MITRKFLRILTRAMPVFVLALLCLAVALSCVFYFVPFFDFLSDGLALIIAAVASAAVAALLFPVAAPHEDLETPAPDSGEVVA